MIHVCSKWIKWFIDKPIDQLPYSLLHQIFEQSTAIISLLCNHEITNGNFGDEMMAEKDWNGFPVDSSWQSSECQAISLATYNLVVACNVSLFSGWEKEEFSLRLLKRQHGNRHFGVHIHGRRMTGFIYASQEEEIANQWNELESLLPTFPGLKFQERIAVVKQKDWYKKEVEDRKQNLDDPKIAKFAEDDGVSLYLAFSRLCVLLAKTESNPKVSNGYYQLCLSVLLPIVSQTFH